MCGIVGFAGYSSATEFITEGLTKLEYRGYDSAGITVLNGFFRTEKTTDRIESLKRIIEDNPIKGNVGIGHTRWATHGAPSIENAHPHISESGKFAVVHNGIIENYIGLKNELISEGYHFKSETDTEVVPELLEKYYNGDIEGTVRKVLERLEGSYALGILCADYPDTLIATKHFSPLIIGIGEKENYIASDITAMINRTQRVIFPEDGDIAFITPKSVKILDSKNCEYLPRISLVGMDEASAEKGGYDHFMLKEIMEQPQALNRTLESYIKDGKIEFGNFSINKEKLESFNKIQIVACGSAFYAGVVAKYVFEELLRIPVEVDVASEYRYRATLTDDRTLLIAISQSGETADTLCALKTAKEKGAHTLAIVNVKESAIAKMADDVIYTKAGSEIAVATTKGYTTQLTVIYMFALWGAKILKSCDSEVLAEIFSNLKELPEKIKKVLLCENDLKEIAKEIKDKNSVFFIGRNTDYAVALEASLKLKEISYIHSESYPAGELKHGTISLIEKGTRVFALLANKKLTAKTVSNIKEVSARGGEVIAFATKSNSEIENTVENALYIPDIHPILTPVLEIIPFQLIAYYTALLKGTDIDKPRNLAKSVTVE